MAYFAKNVRHCTNFLLNQKLSLQSNLLWTKLFQTSAVSTAGLRRRDRAPTLMEFKKRVNYMKDKGLWPDNPRSSFAEWDYGIEIYAFGKRLNEEFNESYLREALIDKSYIMQESERLKHLGMEDSLVMKSNDELAKSGFKIAKDFIPKYLRNMWSLLPEEGIECVTEFLTSNEVFAKIGQEIGLKDLIFTQESPPSTVTYAMCFSAVIGAVHLSSSLEKSFRFIQDFVFTQLVDKDLWDIWKIDNPMHTLQCILSGNGRGDPEPRLIDDIGKLTIEATFYVGIYSDKELLGTGYGETIDMAIHLAALNSLSRLFNQTQSRDPLPVTLDTSEFHLKSIPNSSVIDFKMNDAGVASNHL